VRESEIEDYLVRRVKELGGEVRKVKWIGRNGAPDRIVMLPAQIIQVRGHLGSTRPHVLKGERTIWVELKAPGEKAKPHQVREHERLRKMGQRVAVIDSIEGVDSLLA
jgi:hypothetical protein